jgi:hypothetical protein
MSVATCSPNAARLSRPVTGSISVTNLVVDQSHNDSADDDGEDIDQGDSQDAECGQADAGVAQPRREHEQGGGGHRPAEHQQTQRMEERGVGGDDRENVGADKSLHGVLGKARRRDAPAPQRSRTAATAAGWASAL